MEKLTREHLNSEATLTFIAGQATTKEETMPSHILAIDQGTTSSQGHCLQRCDSRSSPRPSRNSGSIFPQSGWVEHDPEEIWDSTARDLPQGPARRPGLTAADIAAIGITNQRETTIVWDRETGRPIHRAIVWQDSTDRGTLLPTCARRPQSDDRREDRPPPRCLFFRHQDQLAARQCEGRPRKGRGRQALLFGTVDTFLLWRLTGGRQHATDATNASRTLLFNIHENRWDEELLDTAAGPRRDAAGGTGLLRRFRPDRGLPSLAPPSRSRGIAGDQQAALVGQACFQPGMIKSTYGTGCFIVLNTGDEAVVSKNRLLTTIGYRLDGKTTYALEGSIFVAGAAVQWMRDAMGLIEAASETGKLARKADISQDVYLVPAFTGLGAPYWDPDARGAIFGITRATGPAELSRAALESVCYQTRDLLEAMRGDWRQYGRNGAAGRRRHDRLELDHAVPRRYPQRPGRPTQNPGDHRRRRRLPGRTPRGHLPRPGGIRPDLEAGPALSFPPSTKNCGSASTTVGRMQCGGR